MIMKLLGICSALLLTGATSGFKFMADKNDQRSLLPDPQSPMLEMDQNGADDYFRRQLLVADGPTYNAARLLQYVRENTDKADDAEGLILDFMNKNPLDLSHLGPELLKLAIEKKYETMIIHLLKDPDYQFDFNFKINSLQKVRQVKSLDHSSQGHDVYSSQTEVIAVTPLMFTVLNGIESAAIALADHEDVAIDFKDAHGRDVYIYAAQRKMDRLLSFLIKNYDYDFTVTFNGSNAFMIAIKMGLHCAEHMLPHVKNLGQTRNLDGKNALMLAIVYHPKLAPLILDLYPNAQPVNSATTYLLDLHVVDTDGNSALDLARKHQQFDLAIKIQHKLVNS